MIKKLLFPTDFSVNANNALPFALDLVKKNNAKLYIVHVYYTPLSPQADPSFPREITTPSVEGMIYEALEKRMLKFIDEFNLAEFDYEYSFQFGDPVTEIEQFAEQNDIDLIVIGSKGETGLKALFLGSHAKSFIQNAPCPVLAIPSEAKFEEIATIAYATDLRFDETKAIAYFITFAEMYNASLIILHLDLSRKKELQHVNELKKLIEKTIYPRISFQEIIVDDIPDGIEDFVQNNQIDMLAMAPTTTSIFDKILHRSLTKQMLFHAHIPLLTIRRTKNDIVFL